MTNTKSYKNGLIEGVVFCFYKDNKVLLEDRGKGFNVETFFTNGTIEIKDKRNNSDYITNALYREVSEEFSDKINILEKAFLGGLLFQKSMFYFMFLL
ncbi:MAG: hypothetical protein PHC62_09230 [Candidatus Izemoplasmatales bacterium]|jgi:hypothetical protein|nr:hypothetical protein [Candidatus Izemoplasmatales bacterium]